MALCATRIVSRVTAIGGHWNAGKIKPFLSSQRYHAPSSELIIPVTTSARPRDQSHIDPGKDPSSLHHAHLTNLLVFLELCGYEC
jgi:hypothetical protein